MLCPTSALRLLGLYLVLVTYRAFFDAFHSQCLAASRRLPLLVERFLLKCFHLVAFNLVTFNLAPFNLDTSFAVRQLTSYYARLPFANHQLPLCSRRLRHALLHRRSLRHCALMIALVHCAPWYLPPYSLGVNEGVLAIAAPPCRLFAPTKIFDRPRVFSTTAYRARFASRCSHRQPVEQVVLYRRTSPSPGVAAHSSHPNP